MMSMTPLYAYITCHLIYHFCFNSIFLVKWYMICVLEMLLGQDFNMAKGVFKRLLSL